MSVSNICMESVNFYEGVKETYLGDWRVDFFLAHLESTGIFPGVFASTVPLIRGGGCQGGPQNRKTAQNFGENRKTARKFA